MTILKAPLISYEIPELFYFEPKPHIMPIENNIVLFDDNHRDNLLPLTFTRPVAELRVGISTIREKWESLTGQSCSFHTQKYLAGKYPMIQKEDNLFINAGIVPSEILIQTISSLERGQILKTGEDVVAYRSEEIITNSSLSETNESVVHYSGPILHIKNTWDIFTLNDEVLRDDYTRITSGRKSQDLSETNTVLGSDIFIEEGASVECATINTSTGPVYIGRDAEIMEGAIVRGPLAMCEHSALKMGAKIYGATTLGPYCKAGGEVHNSVFTGYSNKAHDGFLGNAVLGEWCNLGADTNNSNLKNNYDIVKIWDYTRGRFLSTGLQFCGLIMGDHSKCAINTMFNTGTVVGVSANIFGAGFPRNFVPSFSWGGVTGFMLYKIDKALKTAEIVMKRRKLELTGEDIRILNHVYELTAKYRKF